MGVLACSAGIASAPPALARHALHHDGVLRSFHTWTPASVGDGPAGLSWILLHGRGGDGSGLHARLALQRRAEAEGWALVYPDGVESEWSYARGLPGYRSEPDDTAFLVALRDALVADGVARPGAVALAGWSNGGFMAQRVACERPAAFAAYVSVAASGFAGLRASCGAAAPLRMLLVHARDDRNVPWNGLAVRARDGRGVQLLWSVPDTFGHWAARAGCDTEVLHARLAGPAPAEAFSVEGCPGGGMVRLVALDRGGHEWPARLMAGSEGLRSMAPRP